MTGHIPPESTNACPTSPTTDIQPELLPCPFDGGDAEIVNGRNRRSDGRGWLRRVACRDCEATGPEEHNDTEAVEAWNRGWNRCLTSTTPTLGDMVMVPREVDAAEKERRRSLSDHDQMLDAQTKCVPCKLCGGSAVVTDAGTGAGYYIACGNSVSFRDSKGCLINERRLGGWAYNVADWWNRLHAAPASPIRTSVANEGEREALAADIARVAGCQVNSERTRRLVDYFASRLAALSPALDNTAVEGARRECQAVWRCAVGDITGALDVLKNRWLKSRRKHEREAGAVLSGVLDFVWAARDPAAASYSEANSNGVALIERVRAALSTVQTEKAR